MVKPISIAAGAVLFLVLLVAFVAPRDASQPDPIKAIHLSPRNAPVHHDGPLGLGVFGTFDRAQLQRGYQVYKEVCAACHSLDLIAFRNLRDIGFSEPEVKALAAAAEVPAINPQTGEDDTRAALPSDHFPRPYANAVAARAANNNALPPDLSLIVKARPNGQDYLYSLLTGYGRNAPASHEVPEGLYFNPYFHSVNIAMAPPLAEGMVTYADGTESSVEQMALDVTTFLRWTAEPELEKRRQIGVATLIFLSILTLLSILAYRRVWANVEH